MDLCGQLHAISLHKGPLHTGEKVSSKLLLYTTPLPKHALSHPLDLGVETLWPDLTSQLGAWYTQIMI